jgi:hypothetical protein
MASIIYVYGSQGNRTSQQLTERNLALDRPFCRSIRLTRSDHRATTRDTVPRWAEREQHLHFDRLV